MDSIPTNSLRTTNATYAYVGAFVDELERCGVQHLVLCPGSRSTPLAITFAEQPQIHVWVHIDERSAAFFALGMAKYLGQPVAVLATSGTAVANFLPAIIEANMARVPLLILTADRPHELRASGDPQAIDQNRLYGTHVKWFVEMAIPEATNAALRYVRTIADRATALTKAVPAGPVHLNFPFRKPLAPVPNPASLPPSMQRDSLVWQGRSNHAPYVAVSQAVLAGPSEVVVTHLVDMLRTAQRGLIIAGAYNGPPLTDALVHLAHRLGYPIIADPLSQLRCGDHDQSLVLTSYDAYLRIDAFVDRAAPEVILRFGSVPTSTPVQLYLAQYAASPLILIDGNGGWDEPTQAAAEMIHADPVALCQNILAHMEQQDDAGSAIRPPSQEWMTMWQQADQVTQRTVRDTMEHFTEPFEGQVFTELSSLLPEGTTLFTGNSLPMRSLDAFFWGGSHRLRLMGNLGARGIDGITSTALGVSAAAGGRNATVLVLGDLSFFHDLNGLLAAKLHQLDLTIVVINNDGGALFSFLQESAYPHFEELMATPTGLDFQHAVQMYGGHFERPPTWEQFRIAMTRSISNGGLHVIEVSTNRAHIVTMHRHLWDSIADVLYERGVTERRGSQRATYREN